MPKKKKLVSNTSSLDITERKQAEEALRESEERYHTLFLESKDAIFFTTQDGRYVDVNQSHLDLFGYTREEMIGMDVRKTYVNPDDRLRYQQEIEQKGAIRDFELKLRKKDGTELDCLLTATVRRSKDGGVLGYHGFIRDITESKQTEEELKESERQYRLLAENANDVIWTVDMNMRPTYMSPSITRLLGYSVDEAMALPMEAVFAPASFETAMKTLSEELAIENMEQKDLSRSRTLELELNRKDGLIVPVEVKFSFIREPDGRPIAILAIARDITERKQAEVALKESEEKLSAMLQSIGDHMSMMDKDLNIIWANEIAKKLFGDIIGKKCYEVYHGRKEPCEPYPCITLKAFEDGKIHEHDTQVIDKDGKIIYFHCTANVALSDEEGKRTAVIEISRDITERKRLEQELQERNRELEAASHAKSEFLASMSHELRTPLNAVIGFSELMLDGVPGKINDEQRQCLSDILSSGRDLLNLINNVLDLSKVEARRMELRLENLNLADVIGGVVKTMKPMLDENRHKVRMSIVEGLPQVSADKNNLRQILLNLLSNAIKFTPPGGRLAIEVSIEGDWCQVSVVDNGIGIKKEDREWIFEAFTQADTLPDRRKEGTGLGLALTKEFVEIMGGRIWVESEHGKGSKFTFTLPLAREGKLHAGDR